VRGNLESIDYSRGFGVRNPFTPRPLFILEVTPMCHHHMYFIPFYRGILVFVIGFTLVLHLTMEDVFPFTPLKPIEYPFTPLRGSREANDASKGSSEANDASKGSIEANDASREGWEANDASREGWEANDASREGWEG
jgi:hypothetical protein